MTIQRMGHVGIVVDDLAGAMAFFVELGLELEGEAPVEGRWVDHVVGLEGVRADIATMRTPDGHGRLELTKFHTPSGRDGDPRAPANALGIRHVSFAVQGIDDVLERLRAHGAELVHLDARAEWGRDVRRWRILRHAETLAGRRRTARQRHLGGCPTERGLRPDPPDGSLPGSVRIQA